MFRAFRVFHWPCFKALFDRSHPANKFTGGLHPWGRLLPKSHRDDAAAPREFADTRFAHFSTAQNPEDKPEQELRSRRSTLRGRKCTDVTEFGNSSLPLPETNPRYRSEANSAMICRGRPARLRSRLDLSFGRPFPGTRQPLATIAIEKAKTRRVEDSRCRNQRQRRGP